MQINPLVLSSSLRSSAAARLKIFLVHKFVVFVALAFSARARRWPQHTKKTTAKRRRASAAQSRKSGLRAAALMRADARPLDRLCTFASTYFEMNDTAYLARQRRDARKNIVCALKTMNLDRRLTS